jgi:glycosyltransferase involved in cell wall biosynthesis
MLIGLDARTVYQPTRRGTGKNLIDLYRHLAAARPDWRVLAYHRLPGHIPALLPSNAAEPRLIEIIGDRVDAWQRWRLPLAAWRDRVDVLHCPANACPSWTPVNTVVTIHDLIPLDMPQGETPYQVRRFEQSIQTACRRAAWILCPSRYTRDRLVGEFNADIDRITINPWAPDSSIRHVPPQAHAPVLEHYGIDGPFVLHFGAGALRKNTRRLLEAWAMIDRSLRREWQLLIVGLDDTAFQDFATSVYRLGIGSNVRLSGFADEADLPTLLSAADVLAYPSLSEGFGLPILDAWATSTAVLTSDCTSLPEVAGDAALLVEPTDPCSIARGLHRLLRDPRLREELIERGRQRLTNYNWQKTAERFAWALEQATSQVGIKRAAA